MKDIEELYRQVRNELYDVKYSVHRILDMVKDKDDIILKNLILDICDINASWDASFCQCKVDSELIPLLKTNIV